MTNSTIFSGFNPPELGKLTVWSGLPGSSRSLAIAESYKSGAESVFIICTSDIEAVTIYNELLFYSEEIAEKILYLPGMEVLPYDLESPSKEITSKRARVFYELATSTDKKIVISSIPTAMQKISSKDHWGLSLLSLCKGMPANWGKVSKKLLDMGYSETELEVTYPGEFILKKDIADIFPVGSKNPVRMRRQGNFITYISEFDIDTQRSLGEVRYLTALPSKEMPIDSKALSEFRKRYRSEFGYRVGDDVYDAVGEGVIPEGIESLLPLFQKETSTIFDYIKRKEAAKIFIASGVFDSLKDFTGSINRRYSDLSLDKDRKILSPDYLWMSESEFKHQLSLNHVVVIAQNKIEGAPIDFGGRLTEISKQPTLERSAQLINPLVKKSNKVLFLLTNNERTESMRSLSDKLGIEPVLVDSWNQFISSKDISEAIITTSIEKGFFFSDPGILVLSEKEVFGDSLNFSDDESRRCVLDISDRNLESLQIGEPIVHNRHGVGRFKGLASLSVDGVNREYMTISYAMDSTAYVKMEDLDMVTRYSGLSIDKAPLDDMNSEKWSEQVKLATEDVKRKALILISEQEKISKEVGIAMPDPGYDYYRFYDKFEFKETQDQRTASRDILRDMTSQRPMNRLVCGDVGFGKTEVAMRAAFIAAKAGYQVAVMVPTTLLSNQHYESFLARFEGFDINIKNLSGYEGKKEESLVLKEIAAGDVNIIIGTQRLIQKDVLFNNLGLIIIDEEHRFGVEDKERLKLLRHNVDSLSMTATPIPRSMNMVMHGIKDVSVIATPPQQRLSIRTLVHKYDDALIKEAIDREIMRSGQVFFLHNRVGSINKRAESLRALIPGLTVDVMHGQMSELSIEKSMLKFYRGETDVLVCTTIIENGINVTNANTIIIESSDKLGLAQLHQLRGRVGRSDRQAYAYMLESEKLSDTGVQRLDAIRNTSRLGQGFLLASHDLEIRGAGEILGEDQSGHMMKIGTNLYFKLLEKALNAIKNNKDLDEVFCENGLTIDIKIPGYISNDYIESELVRISLYKKLTLIEDLSGFKAIQEEVEDRFGPIPEETKDLINTYRLRWYLNKIGVKKLVADENSGVIELRRNHGLEEARLIDLVNDNPDILRLTGPYSIKFKQDMPDKKTRLIKIMTLVSKLI